MVISTVFQMLIKFCKPSANVYCFYAAFENIKISKTKLNKYHFIMMIINLLKIESFLKNKNSYVTLPKSRTKKENFNWKYQAHNVLQLCKPHVPGESIPPARHFSSPQNAPLKFLTWQTHSRSGWCGWPSRKELRQPQSVCHLERKIYVKKKIITRRSICEPATCGGVMILIETRGEGVKVAGNMCDTKGGGAGSTFCP